MNSDSQEMLLKKIADLESEVALYKKAQEISGFGHWSMDLKTGLLAWSDQLYKMLRVEPSDTTNLVDVMTSMVYPEDRDLVNDTITDGIINGVIEPMTFRIIRSDGEIIHLLSMGCVEYANDEPIKLFGIDHDITAQVKVEQELKNAKNEAEAADKIKAAFLKNISHEINTPLNSILGFSELLNSTGQYNQEYVRNIYLGGVRLQNMVSNVVDMAEIDSEQMKLVVDHADITELFSSVYDQQTRYRTDGHTIALSLKIPEPNAIPKVVTDPDRLQRVLVNLLDNAIKYTPHGFVELGCRVTNDGLECYVRDSGVGISQADRKEIFNRFHKIKHEYCEDCGTGLGLAVSYALVRLLGGELSCKSKEGEGSAFAFTIPIVKPISNISPDIEVFKNTQREPLNGFQVKKRVLVVDDEELNLRFIDAVLEDSYDVITARNGLEAVEYITQNPDIDLILMDIKMPIMDGIEATKRIRIDHGALPIIAQTAFTHSADKEAITKAGFSDFLPKPISIHQLMGVMDRYI
ncbi:MAG: response regulator [Fibrobacterales bacterium]